MKVGFLRLPLYLLCHLVCAGDSRVVLGEVVLMTWRARRALGAGTGELFTHTSMDASYCFNLQGLDGRWLHLPEKLLEHIY